MQLEDFWHCDFRMYRLPLITVYKRPPDYPNSYVARLFDVDIVQRDFIVKNTLHEIREAIPDFFYRLERDPLDDPVVVEVWV